MIPRFASSRAIVVLGAAILTNLTTSPTAGAQSVWNNPAGGNIATASNWTGTLPSATQDGYFTLPAAYQVDVGADFIAHNLVVTTGTVTMNLTAGTTLTLASGGAFGPQGGVANLTGSGTLLATGGIGAGSGGTLSVSNATALAGYVAISTGLMTQSSGLVQTGEFMVGTGSGSTGVYNMSGGQLLITGTALDGSGGSLRVGDFSGSGTFNQTGGLVQLTTTSTDGNSLNIGNQGGPGVYNISSGTLAFAGSGLVTMGRSSGTYGAATGVLNISGNALVDISGSGTTANFIIGDNVTSTNNGSGTVNQTSGTLSIRNGASLYLSGFAPTISATNTYNLTGGVLAIGGSSLKGAYNGSSPYAFNLGGGTIRVTGSNLTTSANANLVSGTSSTIDTNGLNATWSGTLTGTNGQLVKKGDGTLTITANNTIASFFTNGGTVSQTSGTTTSWEVGVGSGLTGTDANVGTYSMAGGTLLIAAGTPPPLVGGQASSLRVGDLGGSGTFNQTGGNVTVNGSLNVGNQGGHGVYAISSGTLNLADGMSTLGRTSGSNASSGGSTGVLNLSGSGVVNVSGTAALVGSNWYPASGIVQGSGTINQTGGLLNVANTASLILTGFGNGTYNLTSGTLQIGANSLIGVFGGENGTYNFNLGGGTIKVSGTDLSTDVNANIAAGTADLAPATKFNTNGLNAIWSGSISGAQGGLIKAGTGTLTFNGPGTRAIGYFNTDQGTTRQTAGTTTSTELVVGSNYSAKNGAFTLDGGVVNVSGSTPASPAPSFRVGDFTGTGVFNQNDGVVNADGAVILGNRGGNGTYNLTSGTFNVGQNAIPGTTGMIIGRSRASDVNASIGALNITGGLLHLYSGAALQIGGEDSSDARAVGVVTQSGNSQVIVEKFIQLADTGTGTYNLNGGTLTVGGANGIRKGAGTAAFNLAGGTLALSSSFSTSVNLTVSGTASAIDTGAFTGTFTGALQGTGRVTKVGSGTMLANSTSSAASITVSAGALSGTGKTTGNVTVASGATLAGTINVGGTTTIQQGATFTPGFSPAAVYNDGSLVMAGTMYIELGGANAGTGTFTAPVTGQYDQVLYGGTITLTDDAVLQIASLNSYLPQAGDTFSLLLASGLITADLSSVTVQGVGALSDYVFSLTQGSTSWNGSGTYNAVQLNVLTVPEPGTWALLALSGVFMLMVYRRRRRMI